MAELRTGDFVLESMTDESDDVTLYLSRGGGGLHKGKVWFHADLRLKDDQFISSVRDRSLALRSGDTLRAEYRFRSRRHQRRHGRAITIVRVLEYRQHRGRVWVPNV